jgi:hypothetical protein
MAPLYHQLSQLGPRTAIVGDHLLGGMLWSITQLHGCVLHQRPAVVLGREPLPLLEDVEQVHEPLSSVPRAAGQLLGDPLLPLGAPPLQDRDDEVTFAADGPNLGHRPDAGLGGAPIHPTPAKPCCGNCAVATSRELASPIGSLRHPSRHSGKSGDGATLQMFRVSRSRFYYNSARQAKVRHPAVQHHRRHRQDRHQGPVLRGRHLPALPREGSGLQAGGESRRGVGAVVTPVG